MANLMIHNKGGAKAALTLKNNNDDIWRLEGTPDTLEIDSFINGEFVNILTVNKTSGYLSETYYTSLSSAIDDINDGVVTRACLPKDKKVKVGINSEGEIIVTLLADLSEDVEIKVYKNIILILNGKTLTLGGGGRLRFFENTVCKIDGQIEGSQIIKTEITGNISSIIGASSSKSLSINGGSYILVGNFETNINCIIASGVEFFEIDNSTILSINTASILGSCRTRAIQTSAKKMHIKNSTITADGEQIVQSVLVVKDALLEVENSTIKAITRNVEDAISATAIFNNNGATIFVKDSILYGDAPFDDAETPCSDGLRNYGVAFLENTNVTGTINGVTQTAVISEGSLPTELYVKGGIFKGYSHGGFYFAHGIDGIAYINDATTMCGGYDGEFVDYYLKGENNIPHSPSGQKTAPLGAVYIGGGSDISSSDITVYMDNCTFGDLGYPIVLRGTDGEQNNTLNMSNCKFLNSTTNNDKYRIRIDNNTHTLNVGIGNDLSEIGLNQDSIPSRLIHTSQLYRKLYKDNECQGKDYEALYQLSKEKANKTEIPTKISQLSNDSGFIIGYTETDPTVPAWAKQVEKPKYVASEVEAVSYTIQDLTEEQKNQARINIGAIDQKILEMALAQRTLVQFITWEDDD